MQNIGHIFGAVKAFDRGPVDRDTAFVVRNNSSRREAKAIGTQCSVPTQKSIGRRFHTVRLVVGPYPFTVRYTKPERPSRTEQTLCLFQQFDVMPRAAGMTE
jgi:hypothetical protein